MKTRNLARLLAAFLAISVIAAACGGSDDVASSGDADDGAATSSADGVETVAASACTAGQTDGDLAIFNWTEYMDPELITAFSEEFGVNVTEDNYDSNEAMQPIINAGGSGFDFIVPSDYMVGIMICLLYTSPSPRDQRGSRMPSSA